MRRLFTLILLLSLTALLLPRTGRAQNEVQLDSLEINLWPEYDRAEMLVMYICGLPSKSWPVTLTFRIPKTAIRPSEVAVRTEDGGLYETPFTYKVEGEYIVVSFEATTQNFQLEYYDPLTIDGSKRSYGFIWPGDPRPLPVLVLPVRFRPADRAVLAPAT